VDAHQEQDSRADDAESDIFLRLLRNRLGVVDTETTIVLRSGPPIG
jgi:hypothetical protein